MQAIQIISQDLFDKIRSRFSNLEMGNETGAVTIDPVDARFFDFDFVLEGNNLGRVSISLNDLGSLKVYYSQGITENQDDPTKQLWYKFLKEMRFFAMRRLLRFDTRDISKTNLDKNDFQHLATTQPPKEETDMTTMNESRWTNKSSRKTSRAVQGKTEVIVRHAHPVDEEYAGSRSQKKNIKAIFIQNADGERFKYPFIHTAGAFAMAQHVDHGGVPHDAAGKAIIKMSEQIAQLGEFQRKIHAATLHDDATGITERAIGRMHELKSTIAALGKRHHYETWMAEFHESQDGNDIMELDDVTMEEYKQKFTQTNFQEELASYFPLLHNIMREADAINLEDYVEEAAAPWEDDNEADKDDHKDDDKKSTGADGANHGGISRARHLAKQAIPKEKSAAESIESFEEWAEAVEQGKLTDDQIQELKTAIEQLPMGAEGPELELGPEGQTAIQFFQGLGLDDSELEEKLKDMANVDASTDALQVLKLWADESYPELSVALGISGDSEEPAAPEAPPEAAPAEEPTAENDEMAMNKGTMEGGNKKSEMIKLIAERVKSFYNASNESVGPFRSPENVALDVKKECAEKYGDQAGEQAYQLAETFIDKLTQQWHQKHGQVDHGDGFSIDRLKELVGNIKSKVESIKEKDDWHPSKHVTDPQKKKELEPHDKDVKRGSYADRANYLDAAGVKRDTQQDEGFVGNMIDKAKGMFGKTPAAPAAPAPAAGNNGAHADGKPNSWMEPNMRKDFENAEISSFLLYNIRMIYRWAKEGRNIRNYIQDLKKLEHENISKPTTAAAFKFIMDNLASGEVTDPKMIMQIADKAHTLMGHSDIEQATREGVDKSQVPAVMRKEKGGDWKMSTQDLEKERDQSRTTKPGLDAHAAKMGVGQKHQHESAELASIRKLAGLAK